jgi:hypothetical protein
MYGNGNFVSKALTMVDPVGSAIDKKIAKQNPHFASEYGPFGTPGRAQARNELNRREGEAAADKAAFELKLRTLYPNAFPEASAATQIASSPLGNAFLSQEPRASIIKTIL